MKIWGWIPKRYSLNWIRFMYKVREDNQPPCGFSGKYKVYKCLEYLSFLSHFTIINVAIPITKDMIRSYIWSRNETQTFGGFIWIFVYVFAAQNQQPSQVGPKFKIDSQIGWVSFLHQIYEWTISLASKLAYIL